MTSESDPAQPIEDLKEGDSVAAANKIAEGSNEDRNEEKEVPVGVANKNGEEESSVEKTGADNKVDAEKKEDENAKNGSESNPKEIEVKTAEENAEEETTAKEEKEEKEIDEEKEEKKDDSSDEEETNFMIDDDEEEEERKKESSSRSRIRRLRSSSDKEADEASGDEKNKEKKNKEDSNKKQEKTKKSAKEEEEEEENTTSKEDQKEGSDDDDEAESKKKLYEEYFGADSDSDDDKESEEDYVQSEKSSKTKRRTKKKKTSEDEEDEKAEGDEEEDEGKPTKRKRERKNKTERKKRRKRGGEEGDEGDEEEKKKKKKKRSSKRKGKEAEGEGDEEKSASSASQETKDDDEFDKVLSSLRGTSKRKKTEISDAELDKVIEPIIESMTQAAREDIDANKNKKPATSKLKLLPKIVDLFAKKIYGWTVIRLGGLRAMKAWLQPLPDGSLPNLNIRKALLDLLTKLPVDSVALKESYGLAGVVLFLARNPRESLENKRTAQKLIDEWSRPIFGLSASYSNLAEAEAEQVAKRASFTSSPSAARKVVVSDTLEDGPAEETNPLWWQSRIPKPARMDFTKRPVPRLEANGPQKEKRDPKRANIEKSIVNLKKKQPKNVRSVKISIEGRKMLN